jgi:hypothetical protein
MRCSLGELFPAIPGQKARKASPQASTAISAYKQLGLVEIIDGTEFVDVGHAVRTKKPSSAARATDQSHPLSPFHHSFELNASDQRGGGFECENPSWSNLVPGTTFSVDPPKR